jgi:tetratricopeptide (TPR) repeat protein
MNSKRIEKHGSSTMKGRWISKSVFNRKVLIWLGLVILVVFLFIDEFKGEKVIIDLVEVPKELSEQALTNVAVTRQLVDAAVSFAHQGYNSEYVGNYPLKRLPSHPEDYENGKPAPRKDRFEPDLVKDDPTKLRKLAEKDPASSPEEPRRTISWLRVEPLILSGSKQEPDIEVPNIGSVRGIVRFIKKAILKPTDVYVTGEITIQKDRKNRFHLVLRSRTPSGLKPASIQFGMNIEELINKSGEALLKLAYPCIAAASYYRKEIGTGSFAKTSQLIESCRNDRKEVKYIGDLLSGLIAYQEYPRQPEKAYKHFEAAIDSAPEERKKGDVYFHWGRLYEQKDQTEQAKAMFNKAKEADPGNLRAYVELAVIEAGKSEIASARDQLQEVSSRYPQKVPEMHVELGNRLLDKKRPNDAIAEYKKAIDIKKNNVVAQNNWGIALYYLGKYAEAIEAYKTAIKYDKDFANAYYNWGIALNRLEEKLNRLANKLNRLEEKDQIKRLETKMRDLIRQYKSAVRGNSGPNKVLFLSGVAYLKIGKPQEAINDFEEYSKRERKTDRDFPAFYTQWGDALLQLAQPLDTAGKDQWSRAKRAALRNYEEAGKLRKEAIRKYKKALEIDNNYDLAYYKWGDALLQLAQQKNIPYGEADDYRRDAIRKYEKALEINSNYQSAYYKLSVANYILGEKRRDRSRQDDSSRQKYIDQGKEYYKMWQDASKQDRPDTEPRSELTAELVSQLEPPVPQSPGKSGNAVGLFRPIFPWVAALAVVLAGGIVIVFYNKKGKLWERLGIGRKIGPPSDPSDFLSGKSISSETEDVSTDGSISLTPHSNTLGGRYPAISPHRPAAILTGITGTLQGRKFPVEKEIYRIGADRENDLSIPDDDYVSGKHAQFRYENGRIIIFDMGSRNGTFVNGEHVSETGRNLLSGDRIRIGDTSFEVLDT